MAANRCQAAFAAAAPLAHAGDGVYVAQNRNAFGADLSDTGETPATLKAKDIATQKSHAKFRKAVKQVRMQPYAAENAHPHHI